jgi:hypothetical protein
LWRLSGDDQGDRRMRNQAVRVDCTDRDTGGMGRIVLFLLLACIVLSIIGLLIKAVFWVFIVGLVIFAATAAWGWLHRST